MTHLTLCMFANEFTVSELVRFFLFFLDLVVISIRFVLNNFVQVLSQGVARGPVFTKRIREQIELVESRL